VRRTVKKGEDLADQTTQAAQESYTIAARVVREFNLVLCGRGSYGDGYPKLCTLLLECVRERECGLSSVLFRQQSEGGKGRFIFTVGDFSFRSAWLCTVARH
jgi:hypothetical protein